VSSQRGSVSVLLAAGILIVLVLVLVSPTSGGC